MNPLLRQIGDEVVLLRAIIDLLEREGAALAARDFVELPALAQRKNEVSGQLAACDARREAMFAQLGGSGDRAGADAAVAQGGPLVQRAWKDLLALAARARELNHRNGIVVHAHLDYTRQSIAFLQTGGQALYGPDGQHSAGRPQGLRYAAG